MIMLHPADEYAEKIRNYTKFEEIQIKPNPKNSNDPEVQKASEGDCPAI